MWRVGIMEDNLGNPPNGRFALAREIGFDAVELTFGATEPETLPLWTVEGARRLRQQASEFDVAIPSVCATYFNTFGLGSADGTERKRSIDVLKRLIDTSSEAGAKVILLPFFGTGAMETADAQQRAVDSVGACARRANERSMKLGIEATLPAVILRDIAIRVMDLAVGVYYDVGNVQPVGYNVVSDLRTLADVLVGIHIKDRKNNGDNVPLGRGDVNFPQVKQGLREANYRGYLVLETPHEDDPRVGDAANLAFLKGRLGD